MHRFAFFLGAVGIMALSVPAIAARPPNIVVMLIDDMGMMDTSVPFLTDGTGRPVRYPLNDFYRTPNLERLAAQGIRFNNFCAMSVCSPSRISIMTGQNAARHRTTNWINPDEDNRGPQGAPDWNWRGLQPGAVTLPGLLRAAGYRTIHVGKGHFAPRGTAGSDPANLGFEVNVGGACIGQPGSYYGSENYGANGGGNHSYAVPKLEKYFGTDTFLTEALTLEAMARVTEAVDLGKPFFLYLAHYAVHAPFQPDPRFVSHYAASGKPAAAQAFATLIEGVDKSLGDLLDHLQALRVAEDTLVLFLGDNGTDAPLGEAHEVACAAPLRGKKGSHYEGGMRVPFIAAWAETSQANQRQRQFSIPAGAVQSQFASIEDLFPTLLGIAGVSWPGSHIVDGFRLDRLLSGVADPGRPAQFLMHYPHAPHRSDYFTVWRDGEWKVIYHYLPGATAGGSHYQLFNLLRDPFEQDDLAGSQPAELRRLMEGLTASLEGHRAAYPVSANDRRPLKPVLPLDVGEEQEH